jgi:hypothetical protein
MKRGILTGGIKGVFQDRDREKASRQKEATISERQSARTYRIIANDFCGVSGNVIRPTNLRTIWGLNDEPPGIEPPVKWGC